MRSLVILPPYGYGSTDNAVPLRAQLPLREVSDYSVPCKIKDFCFSESGSTSRFEKLLAIASAVCFIQNVSDIGCFPPSVYGVLRAMYVQFLLRVSPFPIRRVKYILPSSAGLSFELGRQSQAVLLARRQWAVSRL